MNIYSTKHTLESLFPANLDEQLVVRQQELRSEAVYDKDTYAETTAQKYIKKIVQCFGDKAYLLVAGEIDRPNRIRSHKGLFWDEKGLRELDRRDGEFDVEGGYTRLASLVDLDGFNYDEPTGYVLSWLVGIILLTDINIDTMNSFVEEWLMKSDSILPFDYEAIAKGLVKLPTTAVLRYFAADNGRIETLAVVGNKEFVDGRIEKCIRSII